MGVGGQLVTVLASGNDGLQVAAEIGDRAGEDLVRPVGEAGDAGHLRPGLRQRPADGLVDQVGRQAGQAAMPGYRDSPH
jgi:hypothetical protein